MGLGADDNAGIAQNPFGIASGSLPHRSSLAAEMGEELGQDFLRSDNRRPAQSAACLNRQGVPLVEGVSQGDPVNRVGVDLPQGDGGRLGVP